MQPFIQYRNMAYKENINSPGSKVERSGSQPSTTEKGGAGHSINISKSATLRERTNKDKEPQDVQYFVIFLRVVRVKPLKKKQK